jgi:phosphoserine phosphatase
MNQDYNPNSIQSVLSRIETTLKAQDAKLEKIDEQTRQLWRAHSNLRVKVATISATVGFFSALIVEWVRSKFSSK